MTGALWDFALEFYARPGVSPACLTLQDEAGVDVILLIAAVYADRRGTALGAAAIADLRREMAAWREGVVLPLRAARRFLRAPFPEDEAGKEALRSAVKKVELAAEKMQLGLAERWLANAATGEGLPLRAVIEQLMDGAVTPGTASEAAEAAISVIIQAANAGR